MRRPRTGASRGPGVQVRDTQDRTGPALTFTPDAWTAFLATLKDVTDMDNNPNWPHPATCRCWDCRRSDMDD